MSAAVGPFSAAPNTGAYPIGGYTLGLAPVVKARSPSAALADPDREVQAPHGSDGDLLARPVRV